MKRRAARPARKPLRWIGSCQEDLSDFPPTVKKSMGHVLHLAQLGEKAPDAKPMKGFSGASVVEIIEDYDGNTYRCIYTVRFKDVVYALHAFQKKSKTGIATPRHEIDLIKDRLKAAEADYQRRKRKLK